MINNGHTVWILGAGFSKSLGGPLLVDLFRQEYPHDLRDVVGTERAEELTWVQTIYNYGKHRERLWEDPEEFLSYVEDAYGVTSPLKRAKLENVVHRVHYAGVPGQTNETLAEIRFRPYLMDLRVSVRWALAVECSRFLDEAAQDDERWKPYQQWAGGLNAEMDTVITFNYDRVPETLGLHAVLPVPSQTREDRTVFEKVPVFKLHGSVDWVGGPEDNSVKVEGGVLNDKRPRAIAVPGRSKSSWGKALFAPLWQQALRRMEVASSIVILGYGFPKTDAEARIQLLSGIERADGGRVKQIEIVLGPDTNRPENRRVLELVRHRAGHSRRVWVNEEPRGAQQHEQIAILTQHPLWAEDFIGDYDWRTRQPGR